MVPDEEFVAGGQAGFGAGSGHVHDVTDMVSVLSLSRQTGLTDGSDQTQAAQTQALGFSVRSRIMSGRFLTRCRPA